MKTRLLIFLILSAFYAQGQISGLEKELAYQDLCSRSTLQLPKIPSPQTLNSDARRVPTSCPKDEPADFALLNDEELYDYLISVEDPYTCVNRVLYGFHSDYSPMIFESSRVRYIAERTLTLADSFNGEDDNGVHALYTYLSIAGLFSTFYSNDITFTQDTWLAIQEACKALAVNEDISLENSTSLYTLGHMFFTASFDSVGVDSIILHKAQELLDHIAADLYVGQEDLYPYYYCFYYLMDVYLRYPTDRPDFIDLISTEKDFIESIKDVAINLNLNIETFVHFADLSNFAVTAITRYAPHEGLQDVVEPSLTSITETYDVEDSRWIQAALSIVQNGMNFHLTEEEIFGTLNESLFPNNFVFDDGKFIVSTPLTYEEVLPLYQSAQQVRAQFFRTLGRDTCVLDDNNDTLRVKLYGNRDDYRNFNNLLFGVNYPNSGGVYIESYGTFYTYQRTPEESTYSLEVLFRHEYTHYLQGRYLITGGWGDAPMYDNSRLVWFEEGMAQFFAASTRTSNVKALSLIKNSIQNSGSIQDLETVFSSSYATGNPDAYYIYGAMLWTYLYHEDHNNFLKFIDAILTEDLQEFDALVDYFKNSIEENDNYNTFIDSLVLENNIWIDPQTVGVLPEDIDPYDIESIHNELLRLVPSLEIEEAIVDVKTKPRQFKVSGEMSIETPINSAVARQLFNEKLNNYLNNFQVSAYNNFAYTTAYFTDVKEGNEELPTTAQFHLIGPINDFCRTPEIDALESESFGDYTLVFPSPEISNLHLFRYREAGSSEWIELDTSSSALDTIWHIDSNYSIEYQLQHECALGLWTDFSESKFFHPCPDDLLIDSIIEEDAKYTAHQSIVSTGRINNEAIVELEFGTSMEFQTDFSIEIGSVLTINNGNCRQRK